MMIELLDKLYSGLRKRTKIQSSLRFIIREFSNFSLPFYLKFTRKNVQLDKNNIIVSLTTFPQRIDKIWIVVECMVRQKIRPQKIILWLAKSQFPNEYNDLPSNLSYYINNKLIDIRFVNEDLRSHKKYYYALNEYPHSKIIVVDDDIYYPNTIIVDLINLNNKYPKSICCLRAHKVTFSSNNKLDPYKKWEKVINNHGPSFELFHTSGGGTLYQKNNFDESLFDKDIFMTICANADDVWLNIMAQKNKTMTVKSNYFSNLIPIKNKSEKLSKHNVTLGGNDLQIKEVINYYKINKNEIFR